MIFYFSATGNCLDVAKRLASSLDEKLYDVAALNKKGEYSFEKSHGESVGLVIPVYYGGIPLPVSEFLRKFSCGTDLPYVYAVFTYGGSIGGADYRLKSSSMTSISLCTRFSVSNIPTIFFRFSIPRTRGPVKKLSHRLIRKQKKSSRKLFQGSIPRFFLL